MTQVFIDLLVDWTNTEVLVESITQPLSGPLILKRPNPRDSRTRPTGNDQLIQVAVAVAVSVFFTFNILPIVVVAVAVAVSVFFTFYIHPIVAVAVSVAATSNI